MGNAIVGWLCIIIASFPAPVGKVVIKKSWELENQRTGLWLRYIGNSLLIFVNPITHVLAYFYGENQFIAPIISSGVLLNIILAKLFLKEGTEMNTYTIIGIVLFCTGLFSILWSYGAILETSDSSSADDNSPEIEWGIFAIYLGLWMWVLTILTSLILFSRASALIIWSIVAGFLTGIDVIGTYDKWIFNSASNSAVEIVKGIIASLLYTGSSLLSIYIINQLLSRENNPVHIIATIIASISLGIDVFADLFIFQRTTAWRMEDWAMSITGLLLMVTGIWFMNMHFKKTQKSLTPVTILQVCDSTQEGDQEGNRLLSADDLSIHKRGV